VGAAPSSPGFRKQGTNSIQEMVPVIVTLEYLPAFYPSDHDMMQEAG
jgi:hypothetical protein